MDTARSVYKAKFWYSWHVRRVLQSGFVLILECEDCFFFSLSTLRVQEKLLKGYSSQAASVAGDNLSKLSAAAGADGHIGVSED